MEYEGKFCHIRASKSDAFVSCDPAESYQILVDLWQLKDKIETNIDSEEKLIDEKAADVDDLERKLDKMEESDENPFEQELMREDIEDLRADVIQSREQNSQRMRMILKIDNKIKELKYLK